MADFKEGRLYINNINNVEFSDFNSAFVSVLNKHVEKMKTVRANHTKFMDKTIRKAVMTRTRLRNRLLK